MIFTFTACGNTNENNESIDTKIVGQWEDKEADRGLVFNGDHTGKMITLSDPNNGGSFKWSYDSDANVVNIYANNKAYVYYADIDENGNIKYSGEVFKKAE